MTAPKKTPAKAKTTKPKEPTAEAVADAVVEQITNQEGEGLRLSPIRVLTILQERAKNDKELSLHLEVATITAAFEARGPQ